MRDELKNSLLYHLIKHWVEIPIVNFFEELIALNIGDKERNEIAEYILKKRNQLKEEN